MFAIRIENGIARAAELPGAQEVVAYDGRLHSPALIERCLWEVIAHGGNVSKATRTLKEAGVVNGEGKAIARSTLSDWVKRQYRNRYQELEHLKVREIDEIAAAQAQANAIELGEATRGALRQTLAGLSGANAVEASTVLRNISQARRNEIEKGQELRGRDPGSKLARSMSDLAAELAGMGVAKVENEDPETGVLDPEFVHELPVEMADEIREAELVESSGGPVAGALGDMTSEVGREAVGDDDDSELGERAQRALARQAG